MNDLIVPPQASPPDKRDWFSKFTILAEEIVETQTSYSKLLTHHSNRDWPCGSVSRRTNTEIISSHDAEDLLAAIEADVKKFQLQMRQIFPPEEDLLAPSEKYVIRRLGLLVGSFPSGSPASPKTFFSMMNKHIAIKEPSIFAIESACREAVEECKFIPTISEMLPLIEKHNSRWQKRLQLMRDVEHGRLRQIADELIAARKQREAERNADIQKKLDYIERAAAWQQGDSYYSADQWVEKAKFAARWRADECFTADEWREIHRAVEIAKYLESQSRNRRREAKRLKHDNRFARFIGAYPYTLETIPQALAKLHDDEERMLNYAKQLGRPMKC